MEPLNQMLEYSVKLIKLLYILGVNEKLPVKSLMYHHYGKRCQSNPNALKKEVSGTYWYPYYSVGKLKVCTGTLVTEEVSKR